MNNVHETFKNKSAEIPTLSKAESVYERCDWPKLATVQHRDDIDDRMG
jgi:hypothetical protein